MVKYYERGEICVSSPAHMKEYFKNTESTDNFFFEDADGNRWGKTGDVGYIDEDGDVYILGRAADIFISIKGNKIYNFDIEAVIRENCNIKDCEVVGFDKVKQLSHLFCRLKNRIHFHCRSILNAQRRAQ